MLHGENICIKYYHRWTIFAGYIENPLNVKLLKKKNFKFDKKGYLMKRPNSRLNGLGTKIHGLFRICQVK